MSPSVSAAPPAPAPPAADPSAEDRGPVLESIRAVLLRLPDKQLWDVRRLALLAASQHSAVPVLHFEKALSLGLLGLGKAELVAIMSEFMQTEREIASFVLAPLHQEYATDQLAEYMSADLAKAAVKVWELLQVKSRSTRRWLAQQDYERVRWRVGLLSPTLGAGLLRRLVHVSCDPRYVVEEVLDAVDRRIAATRLAYKLSEQLLLTSRAAPDHPALCFSIPSSWTLGQRLAAVLQLLELLAPPPPPAGKEVGGGEVAEGAGAEEEGAAAAASPSASHARSPSASQTQLLPARELSSKELAAAVAAVQDRPGTPDLLVGQGSHPPPETLLLP